jgi:hypothetical protein
LNKLGDRRQWGASASVGSASDKLFHSIHETDFQGTASYMTPSGVENAWLFLLNYSNNRAFLNNVPIPGFAYVWKRQRQGFQAVVGFPFLALSYRPNETWSGRATLAGTTNQSIEIARRLAGPVRLYAAYERSPKQWLRANQDYNTQIMNYDQKKALVGIRSRLGRAVSLDLSGGRTFDRRLFESRDASRTGAPRLALANGWMIAFTLSWRAQAPPVSHDGAGDAHDSR